MLYIKTDLICGKFVNLRIATEEDAEFTLALRQDDKNALHMQKLNVDISQQKVWLRTQADSEDCYFFVIERKNGEKIGTFSLYNIRGNTAETGRLILRGNQIETIEACLLFHDFSYGTVGIQLLFSEIQVGNNAALGLAKRFGSEKGRFIDEKNGVEMLRMVGEKEDYFKVRDSLYNLVDRFAARN